MVKIKICGLKRHEDIQYVNELLPDYIGFVFAKSKRQVDLAKAKILGSQLDKGIKKVGVFVNEDVKQVKKIAKEAYLDVLQFHGDEDESYLAQFNDFTIWKCKSIDISLKNIDEHVMDEINIYPIEGIVLDSSRKGASGGLGQSFNWNLLQRLNIEKKLILAGGLSSENVCEAIEIANPYAVDISSGVETDGVKDFNKIKKFIEKVREQK
ncbi:phosphoribosylanthranilate isomerase [Clostridium akagii]|uniref:phosphoribosylanthranilate isomerase n=1 Tax=Clostridium akagii TaxID=91623 RepID=UPI0004797964|nr:phosphoribosylanthranilate isomerase [Clostridium akagii]